jgi:RimJ/RimL family protein N-acetyltransferase
MNYAERDVAIRPVQERDIDSVAALFRANYGEDYQYPEVFDGTWVKKCIYGDSTICLVLEENDEVVATGAVLLNNAQPNDQVGEIARLVVDPQHVKGRLGNRIINALFETAGENLEFAFGRTRTANTFSQLVMGRAGFVPAGFLPRYLGRSDNREDSIVVIKLHGNGEVLRSDKLPHVIPEVVPLARHVLTAMGLPPRLIVATECPSYANNLPCKIRPLDRLTISQLARTGRLNEPLLIGAVSLEQGFALVRRRGAVYLSAVDANLSAIGAVGYIHDQANRVVKGVELIAESEQLRGQLCQSLVHEAEKLGAEMIEVNVSAYEVRLQRTFADWGFRPVAYLPALVFRGSERLDVVKMMRLETPYKGSDMKLTEESKDLVQIVQPALLSTN